MGTDKRPTRATRWARAALAFLCARLCGRAGVRLPDAVVFYLGAIVAALACEAALPNQ